MTSEELLDKLPCFKCLVMPVCLDMTPEFEGRIYKSCEEFKVWEKIREVEFDRRGQSVVVEEMRTVFSKKFQERFKS